jgi:hypothetical protein
MLMRIHQVVLVSAVLAWGVASAGAQSVAWEFGAESATPMTPSGQVHRDVPGPRPPEFPDFEATNTAIRLDGDGSRLEIADPGAGSPFDFTNGDELTAEAWVEVDSLRDGDQVYIIGKGRTGSAGFAADNQNWALRLRGSGGLVNVGFLFATAPGAPAGGASHWHRWWSKGGFPAQTGWHHVAVTYRFGDPGSIRGWVDGTPLAGGAWDMGGSTTDPPVVDDDSVWIGASMGGNAPTSFRGSLDAVGLHRSILDPATLAARFRREGGPVVLEPAPEEAPDLGPLPTGRVLATVHEGMPAHDRWLMRHEKWPAESLRFEVDDFLLPRLPVRYDAWGIRDAWKSPVLVRLAADVSLPPGPNRLLLRARGLGRLWVDGRLAARTKPLTGSPSGEELITPPAEPPAPGVRPAGHRVQEVAAEVEVGPGGTCRIIIETLAGGRGHRPETGELCLAVQTAEGASYMLVLPREAGRPPTPLTDAEYEAATDRAEAALTGLDDQRRRAASASRDAFWSKRHQAAEEWVEAHPAAAVPAPGGRELHPIDAFLLDRIEGAKTAAAEVAAEEADHFRERVQPILRERCSRCHGEKERGGLRLDSRAAALSAGDSGFAAVVPGDAAESELTLRARMTEADGAGRMPPSGEPLTAGEIADLERWIDAGAAWPEAPLDPSQTDMPPLVDDEGFLRRVYLDTVGVPPTEAEFRAFRARPGTAEERRTALIDDLLADDRWADHWVGYWQDLLAENPTLINAALNATGPFRWFLHESLRDDKPLDRFVTELVMMRGGAHEGGSAGFGLAAQNDAPMATKGQILASAFLGVELQCARCHDSPFHSTKQRDVFALSAMLARKPVTVPKTSSVPPAFFAEKARESLIKVTLPPGEPVAPGWPFAAISGLADDQLPASLMEDPGDTRERLAAFLTAPQNERFAQVAVNRVWRRLMGAGIVEPPSDWEGRRPSHPDLLRWLAREFVGHGYSLKHVARLVLTSEAYQRRPVGRNRAAEPDRRFFNAPDRRRLTAEQVVDALHTAAGRPIDSEELTYDPDGRRPADNRLNLGRPTRAWMFVTLSNERDRPSLTLPAASAVVEVLETFGWSGDRQSPRADREAEPNVLQPGVLANSPLSVRLTRAAVGSPLAELAVEAESPSALVDSIFIRFLGREPRPDERSLFVEALAEGFDGRLVPADRVRPPAPPERLPRVTWSNHLRAEANEIQLEWARRVRQGPPPDPRLEPAWREVYEDIVWSVVNSADFVWIP